MRLLRASLLAVVVASSRVVAAPAADDAQADALAARIEQTRACGRAVDALLVAGDVEAIARLLHKDARRRWSARKLRDTLEQLRGDDLVGPRTDENVLIAAPTDEDYEAEHTAGARTLAFKLAFDVDGALRGLWLRARPMPAPDPHASATPHALRFPLDVEGYVFQGGAGWLRNPHTTWPDQRYAVDVVLWRDGGSYGIRAGTDVHDYGIFGATVRAPASGVVVTTRDGVDDNVPWHTNPREPFGNHLVLDVDGAFVVLGHLQRGSVRVQPGQRVQAGDVVGLVGNSGNTTEPHLHVHLQDGPTPKHGDGLPIAFVDVTVDGVPTPGSRVVERGQRVAPQTPPPTPTPSSP